MQQEHPHRALVRRLWEAGARGEAETFYELYAPDAVIRTTGVRNPFGGEFKGIDEILHYMARAGEDVDDLRSELVGVYTSDSGAVIRYHTVANRGPKHLDMEYLLVLAIEGGRIVEGTLVPTDQQVNDDFWREE